MKAKLIIGAALFAAFSNIAVAVADSDSFTILTPTGTRDWIEFDEFGYKTRHDAAGLALMQVTFVPKRTCGSMLVGFDVENDGFKEMGSYLDVTTEAGRKQRSTMTTTLRPGGTLRLKSITCKGGPGGLQVFPRPQRY